MTMTQASDILGRDLQAAESLLRRAGYEPFANVTSVGPTDGDRGLFVRFNAQGEEYVFTLSGPAGRIEDLIMRGHERVAPHLARLDASLIASAAGEEPPAPSFQGREVDPRQRRRNDRLSLHQHTFSIQRRPDGLWTACVCIPVPGGPLYLCATADEHAVAQALQSELSAVSGGRVWANQQSFQAACGAVASARAEDRLGSALRNMVRDPGVQAIFASVVPMVPFVGPPASLAFQGAKLAMDLQDKAEKGDPKARAAVAKIVVSAKKGDVNAKRAMSALQAAKLAKKAGKKEQEAILLRAQNEDLRAQNRILQEKLDACAKEAEQKWSDSPKEAAEDFLDQWGGSEEYVGLDLVKSAGDVIGELVESSGNAGRRLASPLISHYFRERIPAGPVVHRDGSPEVGALYHRPMREASEVALRRDYLRGQAIMTYGPERTTRFLSRS